MRRPSSIDPSLTDRPFSIADARTAGVSRGRLAGADLHRPFRGVRSVGERSAAESYAPLLRPGDRFSHTTAAELWGTPLPLPLRGLTHVTAAHDLNAPRTRGVMGHRSRFGSTTERNGLPVSDAASTFVELAGLLEDGDLVAVGDFLIHSPRVLDPTDLRPHTSLAELHAAVERYPTRGRSTARRALARVRSGVESPMETALRLLLEDAGMPRPECGYELRDRNDRHIGWFDLAWPEYRAIAEYDGDQHRESTQQYELDIRRFDAAAEAEWRVVRVRSTGVLRRRGETVERVQRALQAGGWAPNFPKSI